MCPTIESFIAELYRRCEARGALRQVNANQPSVIEELMELLIADRLEEAMRRFRNWLEELGERGKDLLDDLTLLASRYRRLVRKINQGVLSGEEAGLETNKIRSALLALINEAKDLE